ncbi:barstar family protein [Streptomyces griseoincarnatus]
MSGRDGQGPTYTLTSDEDDGGFWGVAAAADGLFTPLPGGEGERRVRLAGCSPQGGLLRSVDRAGTRRAMAGNAWLGLLDDDGVTMGSYFVNDVTVADVRPSSLCSGLLDLTVTCWCDAALPGAERVWGWIRTGRLNRTGMWRELSAEDRRAWLSVALWSRKYLRQGRPDAPPGRVVTLDGRAVVDRDAFYCALGEAVNGPCGYFGWNLDALDDCLRGGWGATPPFTLRWDHSAESRARLAERVSVGDREVTLFELLLQIFEDRGLRVDLR